MSLRDSTPAPEEAPGSAQAILRLLFDSEQYPVWIDAGTRKRIKAWIRRYNDRPETPMDATLDPSGDISLAIYVLADCGLQRDEEKHGLVGTLRGDVIPREEYQATRAREREGGLR